MAETSSYLLQTYEHRRDSYGFALRPQHLQRYREYAKIYQEEEKERVGKWKNFLEQHAKSAILSTSEKENTKADIEQSVLIPSGGAEEGEDKSATTPAADDSAESTKDKVPVSQQSEVKVPIPSGAGEDGSGRIASFDTLRETESLPSGEAEEGEDKSATTPASDGSAESTKDKVPVSQQSGVKIPIPAGAGEDRSGRIASFDTLRDTKSTKEYKKLVSEQSQVTVPNTAGAGEDQSGRTAASTTLTETESSIQNEVQVTKDLKTHRVQTWNDIRPVFGAFEKMMSFRVKQTKQLEDKHKNDKKSQLPSIAETAYSGETFEDGIDMEADESAERVARSSLAHRASSEGVPPEHFFPWKEELESLVCGGVPKDMRGEVWQAFVGVRTRRIERHYQDLLACDEDAYNGDLLDNSSISKKLRKQIEKDLPRTFPGHPALDEHGRDSLRRLLLAYARHNPSVGYCQAMNFFAGLLLLLMPEENAFWTLVGIIDDYFEGYFTEDMIESQVDQLVFEELMRERFPKLVNHLDFLGVQVTWISTPWFLSIFVNMLPWESVLRVWDVLLFEGNRVMLFRTALALMELYGPALVTTKDAGDAVSLLQSLAGSTFDSSQLVLTASMGFLAVTEARLKELRDKHRPAVVDVVEERTQKGLVGKDTKGVASKLYSFKRVPTSFAEETKQTEGAGELFMDAAGSHVEHLSSYSEEILSSLSSKVDSLPDLQEQVTWMKVELCRLMEEKRSAVLRAEELETALVEMVKQDNRLQLSARVEQLEQEVAELHQAIVDKKEQEMALLQVLMRVEQEQRVTEDARRIAEQDAAAQRYAAHILQEKYEKAMTSLAQMEKRAVMAETMLEATLQYESGQAKAHNSPRSGNNQTPTRRTGFFGLGWMANKGKTTNLEESRDTKPTNGLDGSSLPKESSNR